MLGREVDPMTEVLITSGANGALSSFVLALVNPGDEVVVFEPCFPMHLDHIEMAKGVHKAVPLRVVDGSWTFDQQKLRS
jgi:aspartate/methionine/tyrosine aminotransferase